MSSIDFQSFTGKVIQIEDYPFSSSSEDVGCYKFITVQDDSGNIVNFIAGVETYFVRHKIISVGDIITVYYDGNTPVILIYPPQYVALIIVKESDSRQVKVDYFNEYFISRDGMLQLSIVAETPILLTNGQPFTQNPARRNLIVIYRQSTKSIPALTTPEEIITYCRQSLN